MIKYSNNGNKTEHKQKHFTTLTDNNAAKAYSVHVCE